MGAVLSSRAAAGAVARCTAGGAAGPSELSAGGSAPSLHDAATPQSTRAACSPPPGSWDWYRDFWFGARQADIKPADAEKITDIVRLLRRNPAQCVGIDGTTRERGNDLGRRRIANLRDALLRAGISTDRILTGDLGNPGLRHAQRVEVLVGPP